MKTIKFKKNHEATKRIFFLVFALLSSLNLSAQTTFIIGNLKYTITSDSTVSVSKKGTFAGELVIPESVKFDETQYSVTNIGERAFDGCSGLTSVVIPNSMTRIGNYAFYGCTGLTSVTIPNSVTSIGDYAFCECSGLASIIIPNSVTSIGDYVFRRCRSLISGTIPNSVTNIGNSAFSSCTNLTNIAIGNSVTSLGNSVFAYCRGLTSITIPNSVTSIGYSAFRDCTGLTSVTIPNSVASIKVSAFYQCTGLIEINVDENNAVYSSIDGVVFNKSQTELIQYPSGKQGAYLIPNSVTIIGEEAFNGCINLTSVTIPNSVTDIGGSAFFACANLTSAIIPNSVTKIQLSTFAYCSSLTSVTIPNSVTKIQRSAFINCTSLTEIYCHIEEPLTITSDVFKNVLENTCTLHVPIGSGDAYRNADVWKEFNIVEDLPTNIVSIDNSQSIFDNEVWYTLNGIRLNGKPTKAGVYIVNGKRVIIK